MKNTKKPGQFFDPQPDHASWEPGPEQGNPKNGVKWAARGQNLVPGVRLRQSERNKTPKVGGCTLKMCPQNCGLSHVAQDTGKSWFLAQMSEMHDPDEWGLGMTN